MTSIHKTRMLMLVYNDMPMMEDQNYLEKFENIIIMKLFFWKKSMR